MEAYTLAAIVSVSGAIVTGLMSIWNIRNRRLTQQLEAYRAIHELYDRVVSRKLETPAMLALAHRWDDNCMRLVYSESEEEHASWAKYYAYAELCVGFCNTVLQAHSRNVIGQKEFERQWKHLVKLVVTEHYPIISGFLVEAKYVSEYLVKFVADEERGGWDWHAEHHLLAWEESENLERSGT